MVLTPVSAENPCSQRHVVENGAEKSLLGYQLLAFTFYLRSRTLQVTPWIKVVDGTGHMQVNKLFLQPCNIF